MLRYRDMRVNPGTKQAYRDRLTRLGKAFPLPTEAENVPIRSLPTLNVYPSNCSKLCLPH
jgi:hypothetical protein